MNRCVLITAGCFLAVILGCSQSRVTIATEPVLGTADDPGLLIDVQGFPAGVLQMESGIDGFFGTRTAATTITVPRGTRIVLIPPRPTSQPASTKP